MISELRCTGPHPHVTGWECRALLAIVQSGSVSVQAGNQPPAGCVVLRCRRCGAEYVVCPVEVTERRTA